jgi:hypothetical protein
MTNNIRVADQPSEHTTINLAGRPGSWLVAMVSSQLHVKVYEKVVPNE